MYYIILFYKLSKHTLKDNYKNVTEQKYILFFIPVDQTIVVLKKNRKVFIYISTRKRIKYLIQKKILLYQFKIYINANKVLTDEH